MNLPKEQRRPWPEPPKAFNEIPIQGKSCCIIYIGMTSDKMKEYNDEAFKDWNEKALVPCENCGRTFLPDRLVVHLRSCKPKENQTPMKRGAKDKNLTPSRPTSTAGRKAPSTVKKTSIPKNPPGLIWYIWGRKYGTTSLDIHLKSWEKQFEAEQSKLPPGERRPVPQPPTNFDEIRTKELTEADMDRYNEEAFKNYNEKALVPCQNWGRTFLPDRLTVHLEGRNNSSWIL